MSCAIIGFGNVGQALAEVFFASAAAGIGPMIIPQNLPEGSTDF